jgi:hypothetical protein
MSAELYFPLSFKGGEKEAQLLHSNFTSNYQILHTHSFDTRQSKKHQVIRSSVKKWVTILAVISRRLREAFGRRRKTKSSFDTSPPMAMAAGVKSQRKLVISLSLKHKIFLFLSQNKN